MRELTPTQNLVEYVSVFLDKNLSKDTLQKIKVVLLQEFIKHKESVIKDFCEQKKICSYCADKLGASHESECWDNK